jgi:hypothetical protein
MTRRPRAGLELLETLDGDDRMVRHYRPHTVRDWRSRRSANWPSSSLW